MVDAPLLIIYKMALLFLSSTLDTAVEMFGLLGDLVNSLAYTIAVAGPIGMVIALTILIPTIYFLSRFFGDTAKMTIIGIALLIIVLSIILALVG